MEMEMELPTLVIDDRVFLLGLDKLYRDAMKRHERGELLRAARRVAKMLETQPADVPIEGYYAEDAELTEYFRLIRALKNVGVDRTPSVSSLPEFQRLLAVTSSPLYGRSTHDGKLLPSGSDPLTEALFQTRPWSVDALADAACRIAIATDNFSLVGLAARVRDTVILAAARESVVLYVRTGIGHSRLLIRDNWPWVWKVDADLSHHGRRFVETFNALFGENLPLPDPSQGEAYWNASQRNDVYGRCVCIGTENRMSPEQHYHWGICHPGDGAFEVEAFWSAEVWTTTRYRSSRITLDSSGRRSQGVASA